MLSFITFWQKKKLSSKLGPQWSKEEIESFYEAYRKYGQDWKKARLFSTSTSPLNTLYSVMH